MKYIMFDNHRYLNALFSNYYRTDEKEIETSLRRGRSLANNLVYQNSFDRCKFIFYCDKKLNCWNFRLNEAIARFVRGSHTRKPTNTPIQSKGRGSSPAGSHVFPTASRSYNGAAATRRRRTKR